MGRPYEAIEKTLYWRVHVTRTGEAGTQSISQALAYARTVAALGFDTLVLVDDTFDIYDPAVLDLWATDLLPAIHDTSVTGR